jgi:hypothetical protein
MPYSRKEQSLNDNKATLAAIFLFGWKKAEEAKNSGLVFLCEHAFPQETGPDD